MGEGKETQEQVRFLDVMWTDKMWVSVDCDKLCMYDVILRAITK